MILKCKLHETDILKCSIKTDGAAAKTQSKTVTPSDAEQTVYPDAGYLLSSVKVEPMPAPPTQSKTVVSAVNQQTVLPDDGFYLSSVTVDGMPTETAEVTPTEQAQTVQPSEGKLLSEVAVGAIPAQYHDTSNADITADDVTQGKIAFGASGQIIGTNDFVKPQKGIIFSDWDENGYPARAKIVGLDRIPNLYMLANSNGGFTRSVKHLEFDRRLTGIGQWSFRYMQGIENIIIPALQTGVGTTIDEYGLGNCGFKSVTIDGILGICGVAPFIGCTEIETFKLTLDPYRFRDLFWASNGNAGKKITLYDFSCCTVVFAITNTSWIPHAVGCVIRVPQSLLTDWQNADVWKDLTDVVWQGV